MRGLWRRVREQKLFQLFYTRSSAEEDIVWKSSSNVGSNLSGCVVINVGAFFGACDEIVIVAWDAKHACTSTFTPNLWAEGGSNSMKDQRFELEVSGFCLCGTT